MKKYFKFLPAFVHFLFLGLFIWHAKSGKIPFQVAEDDEVGNILGIGVAVSAVLFWIFSFLHYLIFQSSRISAISKAAGIFCFLFVNYFSAIIYTIYLSVFREKS